MAKNKENFKGMNKDELQKRVNALREDLRVIKWKAEGAKPKNVKESLAIRKNIARALTAINAK